MQEIGGIAADWQVVGVGETRPVEVAHVESPDQRIFGAIFRGQMPDYGVLLCEDQFGNRYRFLPNASAPNIWRRGAPDEPPWSSVWRELYP